MVKSCTIILAAGAGSRYQACNGQDKLQAPAFLDDSNSPSVLKMTLEAFAGVTEQCVLVVPSANPGRLTLARQCCAALGIHLLAIESRGLGHSLAQAVTRYSSSNGWLVGLADMPYVGRDTLEQLADTIAPGALVAPVFDGRRGHPRVIGSDYRPQLAELGADRGAQGLFAAQCHELVVNDPGILLDIDRPEDRLSRAGWIERTNTPAPGRIF